MQADCYALRVQIQLEDQTDDTTASFARSVCLRLSARTSHIDPRRRVIGAVALPSQRARAAAPDDCASAGGALLTSTAASSSVRSSSLSAPAMPARTLRCCCGVCTAASRSSLASVLLLACGCCASTSMLVWNARAIAACAAAASPARRCGSRAVRGASCALHAPSARGSVETAPSEKGAAARTALCDVLACARGPGAVVRPYNWRPKATGVSDANGRLENLSILTGATAVSLLTCSALCAAAFGVGCAARSEASDCPVGPAAARCRSGTDCDARTPLSLRNFAKGVASGLRCCGVGAGGVTAAATAAAAAAAASAASSLNDRSGDAVSLLLGGNERRMSSGEIRLRKLSDACSNASSRAAACVPFPRCEDTSLLVLVASAASARSGMRRRGCTSGAGR